SHPEKLGEGQRTGSDQPTVEQWTGAVGAPQPVSPEGDAPTAASPDLPPNQQRPGATPLKSAEAETPKPAAHAPPAKPAGPAPIAWQAELVDHLRARFGSGIREASTYLGQNYLVVESSVALHALSLLHGEEGFDYLVDVTAVHYPQRERQFEVVWILYSFNRNQRIRVKSGIAEGQSA